MIDIKVPSPGESITEVQIARWIKKDGDYVEKDEEIAEIDSDKATLSLVAEASGKLTVTVNEGESVAVGSVVATIDETVAAPATKEKTTTAEPKKEVVAEKKMEAVVQEKTASPAAKKLMADNAITTEQLTATGKGGRITKQDVLAASQNGNGLKTSAAAPRESKREKMTTLRKKLSQRLVAVKNQTAMLTTFNEIDMSTVMAIRTKYKDTFKEQHGVGLGFMSFFTKAVCEALQAFPMVNAYIDNDEIELHNYCDVAIAVSAPKGLMVPVIRDAQNLSLAQIEKEILALATKARDGKLTIDEMTGGTFTITNGGVFGSLMSTPILNPPQSAILGMHNIVERPVAVNGAVVIRPMMYVALSYDHRIIDGKESVGFLVKIKQMIEDPVKMFFAGEDPVKKLLQL